MECLIYFVYKPVYQVMVNSMTKGAPFAWAVHVYLLL